MPDEKWKARALEVRDFLALHPENAEGIIAAALAEAAAAGAERGAVLAENYEHVNAGVSVHDNHYWEGASDAGQDIAAAIRAREQKP